jgi:hypothetical protein
MSPSSPTAETLPLEAIEFASRMYNAARQGDLAIFKQALPAGLPANLTNDKGDTLVRLSVLKSQDQQIVTDVQHS